MGCFVGPVSGLGCFRLASEKNEYTRLVKIRLEQPLVTRPTRPGLNFSTQVTRAGSTRFAGVKFGSRS